MAAAAVLVAGAAISAYGAIQKAEDEASAQERQAYVKRLQAGEALKASEREAELTMSRARDVRASQASSFGRSGVDFKGTPLMFMAKTMTKAEDEAHAIREAGKYRAFTSNYEAAGSNIIAGQTRTAGYITALGGALGAAGSYGQAKGNL